MGIDYEQDQVCFGGGGVGLVGGSIGQIFFFIGDIIGIDYQEWVVFIQMINIVIMVLGYVGLVMDQCIVCMGECIEQCGFVDIWLFNQGD